MATSQSSPSLPSTAKMDGDAKRYEQRGVSADKGDVHAAIKSLGHCLVLGLDDVSSKLKAILVT